MSDIDENDIEVRAWDVEVRAPGGQQAYEIHCGVVVLHRPTGIAVVIDDERSRLKNKALAIAKLRALVERHAAGREHVERVVREELRRDFGDDYEVMLDCLARRAADRLSVPVLSEEERDKLAYLVGWCNAAVVTGAVTVGAERIASAIEALDRLIAAGKP